MGIIETLSEKDITNNELNLLLYVARFQDEFGEIKGIHYNKACEVLNISVQGFYDALNGLKQKKIITYKHRVSDYDITIVGNCSAITNKFAKGYISMGHPIFCTEGFKRLPAKAKLFMMHLMREEAIRRKNTRYKKESKSLQRIKVEFLDKFAKLLKVSERTVRTYLSLLEKNNFVSVYLENGRKYFITLKEGVFRNKKSNQKTENEEWREHQVECALRRNRIKNDTKKSGLLRKLSVYTQEIKRIPKFDFSFVLKETIQQQNEGKANKYKWKKNINLKCIEEHLQELIAPFLVYDAMKQAASQNQTT